jgi:hypothetical protein
MIATLNMLLARLTSDARSCDEWVAIRNGFRDLAKESDRRVTDLEDGNTPWDPMPAAPPPRVAHVLTYAEREQDVTDYIMRRSDGNVTEFVAVSRAIELARAGLFQPCKDDGSEGEGYKSDPIANALDTALGLRDRILADGGGS